MSSVRESRVCWYCDREVVRWEDDHFPIPARHGGPATVPACVECHDLKDRIPAEAWPLAMHAKALTSWRESPREFRIYFAKVVAVCMDMDARLASHKEERA